MSSRESAPTLDLGLQPSLRAVIGLSGFHVVAVALVFLAQPPKFAALGIAAAFFASWIWLRRHPVFGYGPRAIVRVIAQPDRSWTLVSAPDVREEAQLLGNSYVTAWLVVLNFRTAEGRHRSRAILGDEAPAEPLRRLRARLLAMRGADFEANDGAGES